MIAHLAIVPKGLHDQIFPPEPFILAHDSPAPGPLRDRLAIGVPHRAARVAHARRDLRSLAHCRIQIAFISSPSPGWPIPPKANGHAVEMQRAAWKLHQLLQCARHPLPEKDQAAGVVIFQDDIEVAAGLKDWCEAELFPASIAVWSHSSPRAFTPTSARASVLSPARQDLGRSGIGLPPRLSRAIPERSRNSARSASERTATTPWSAAWAKHRGIGIAFHSPSLVSTSAASRRSGPAGPTAASSPTPLPMSATSLRGRPAQQPGKVGWSAAPALPGSATQNADFARHFEIDRWLIPAAPRPPLKLAGHAVSRRLRSAQMPSPKLIDRCADRSRLDPFHRAAPTHLKASQRSREEWASSSPRFQLGMARQSPRLVARRLADLPDPAYLSLCLRLAPDTVWMGRRHVPWPIDADRFRFRQRARCDRFVFINGMGGHPELG